MDVRPATAADIDAISAIHAEEVRTSVSTFNTEPLTRAEWQTKLDSTAPGDHFLVGVDGEEVLGFAYSSAYRPKAAYARTREVTVYLAASARGRGVGRRLYDVLLPAMRADGVHLAVAVIARPNPASEGLHAACGFSVVGVLPEVGWKLGRWVDTAIHALVLDPDA